MEEPLKFHFSEPIWESRLAFGLFFPAGLFFIGMLIYLPPENLWLRFAGAGILAFFIIGSLKASFGTWRLQELEIHLRQRGYRVKEGKAFFCRWREETFHEVTAVEVVKTEFSESTRYVVQLSLDRKSFPICEFSSEQDAEIRVTQLISQL